MELGGVASPHLIRQISTLDFKKGSLLNFSYLAFKILR
jgi:hypothetical protein